MSKPRGPLQRPLPIGRALSARLVSDRGVTPARGSVMVKGRCVRCYSTMIVAEQPASVLELTCLACGYEQVVLPGERS